MTGPHEPDASDGPPRAAVIAAIAVAALAIVGLLIFVAVKRTAPQRDPVAVVSIPAPGAGGEQCRSLLAALPDRLGDYRRAPLAEPAPPAAAAWRRDGGSPDAGGTADDVVILRCGLDEPGDFVAGAPVQMVDDVSWFRVADAGRTTWTTVDRAVFIALTLPDGSGPSPIQLVSQAVARSMPAVAVAPRPVR